MPGTHCPFPFIPMTRSFHFSLGCRCCPQTAFPGRPGTQSRPEGHRGGAGGKACMLLTQVSVTNTLWPFLLLPASGLQWRQAAGGTATTQDHRATTLSTERKGAELQLFKAPEPPPSPVSLLHKTHKSLSLSKPVCMAFFHHFALNSIYPKPNSRFPRNWSSASLCTSASQK